MKAIVSDNNTETGAETALSGDADQQTNNKSMNIFPAGRYANLLQRLGQGPVVFSHGVAEADAFEDQMFFLASRLSLHCSDRCSHGRSSHL
jgi:hypothetical protein